MRLIMQGINLDDVTHIVLYSGVRFGVEPETFHVVGEIAEFVRQPLYNEMGWSGTQTIRVDDAAIVAVGTQPRLRKMETITKCP